MYVSNESHPRLPVIAANLRWSLDFFNDSLTRGGRIRVLLPVAATVHDSGIALAPDPQDPLALQITDVCEILVPLANRFCVDADEPNDALFASHHSACNGPHHDPVDLIPSNPHPPNHRLYIETVGECVAQAVARGTLDPAAITLLARQLTTPILPAANRAGNARAKARGDRRLT